MIIAQVNPLQIILEVKALSPDGAVKIDVASAHVRVYHVDGGSDVNDLPSTAMPQVGDTNTWRYVWEPTSLPANAYIAEYILVDSTGMTVISGEDIVVGYLESKVDAVQTDLTTLKEIETGRWKIESSQLILYKSDNITEIVRFNLFDESGNPTSESPVDRIRIR